MWQNNEDGPTCFCGNPTVVKEAGNGRFVLLCLFHTAEEGSWFVLPAERPETWEQWTIEDVADAWARSLAAKADGLHPE